MTEERAKKMLKAKLECLKRETSGTDDACNQHLCEGCSLNYEQGNMGEQKEALEMAIKALEQESITWIVGKDNCQVAVKNMPIDKIQKICAIIKDEEQQPCEDCVSREALKEKKVYSEERHEYVIPVAEIDWLPSVKPQTVTDFADKCKECGKILNETYQQRWIPVSEEPKEQGSYITTIKYGDKYAVGQRYYHGKYVGWEDSCVIAYMPLPEPYKEDSNGE